jgi:lysophospholipase L1-like esterase
MKSLLLFIPVLAAAQHFDLTAIAPTGLYSAARGYGYETPAVRPPFHPARPDPISSFQIPPEPRAAAGPRLFVIGDSTANNANRRGWGDPVASYFDIPVFNRARAGRSSRTFVSEGWWDGVRAELQPGDFVLIQFGHNDGGPPDRDRARGSLPGTGVEAAEFTLPDGRRETVYSFGGYLRRMIREAKAAGATPIVLSLTVRSIWKDGKVERGSGRFGEWSAEVARSEDVAFANVTAAIADTYDRMGEEKVRPFFPEDHTHTTPEGAELNSSLVVAALKGVPYSPLTDYLSSKGRDVKPHPGPAAALPARLGLPTPANPALPTLFLTGDSTVRNGRADGANGQWGWGEPIVDLFDAARINVVNRAVGGLSSRTFLTQGWWDRTLALIKPGDFVLIQFGHNDSGPLDDAARARGTLPGVGGESRDVDNPLTMKRETVHTYGWYLRKIVADARARGATPILCTLVPRKIWKDGRIVRDADSYAAWARAVAASEKVPLIDLNETVARRYDELGAAEVDALFADPHTHTSRAGAELNARSVVEGLRSLRPNPLAGFLR